MYYRAHIDCYEQKKILIQMNKFTCRLLLVPTNIIFPKRTVLVFTES